MNGAPIKFGSRYPSGISCHAGNAVKSLSVVGDHLEYRRTIGTPANRMKLTTLNINFHRDGVQQCGK